jgi:3-phytase
MAWRDRLTGSRPRAAAAVAVALATLGAVRQSPPVSTAIPVKPLRATEAVPDDPDDPAIWVNAADPARSLIVGTVKVAAPNGALAVFGLDGKIRQLLKGPDRPNNVDVEYGLTLAGRPTDIAVLTERLGRRLRVYAIASDGSGLRDVSSGTMPILARAPDNEGAPMGIGLYRRPADGAIFAIVAPKAGPATNYLWEYRLEDDGTGRVKATFARRFGSFSGTGEIEAVAVDDALGYVYYADEDRGIHKYFADPDRPDAATELAYFATSGYQADREGIGIYARPDGAGYIVSVDQLPGESIFRVYKREGEPGRPHDHSHVVKTFRVGADSTDGLDVTSASLGPEFPGGLMVAMNSTARNFLLVRWEDIAITGAPQLVAPMFRSSGVPKSARQ